VTRQYLSRLMFGTDLVGTSIYRISLFITLYFNIELHLQQQSCIMRPAQLHGGIKLTKMRSGEKAFVAAIVPPKHVNTMIMNGQMFKMFSLLRRPLERRYLFCERALIRSFRHGLRFSMPGKGLSREKELLFIDIKRRWRKVRNWSCYSWSPVMCFLCM